MKESPRKIVVIGGGVAGLEIATSLGRARRRGTALEVTLVDRDIAHVWKPMLHTIAAGTRDLAQQQIPFVGQAIRSDFAYQTGELTGLDASSKVVRISELRSPDGRLLAPERTLEYDALVLAIGSQANAFGTPGVAEYCRFIDSRLQAEAFYQEVRIQLLQAMYFERKLDLAVVGGGATGVELAAELVQLTRTLVSYGVSNLEHLFSLTLIEAGPRLLPAFPEDISEATRKRLESIGVRVELQQRVQAVDAEGLALEDGRRLDASLIVWAAGVQASPVLSTMKGVETLPSNQIQVLPSLQTTTIPDVFAVGDCASLQLPGRDRPLPPTAQVAHQQAKHLIRHMPRYLRDGVPPPAFRYSDFGALVSLADYDAYGSLGDLGFFKGVTIKGRLAHLSHAMLYRSHQSRLYGFWRGTAVWLADLLGERYRTPVRFD